ncbi:MAG TPA: ABC transporter permease [Thermoanaerobaculia bacterium]|jgi:predicted permease
MASWRRAFRLHLRGGTVEQDVEDEIAFHLQMREQELIEEGVEPRVAREEALRHFGDLDGIRRRCREIGRQTARGRHWTEVFVELRQDAVFALRQLRKTPGFTLVAILTLALGIGATTAIFGGLYGVVLRPLPFPHAERIVFLWSFDHGEMRSVSPGNFRELQRSLRSIGHLAAMRGGDFTLSWKEGPERIDGVLATAEYFAAFGARPALGRVFAPDEDRPGRERVAVLSQRLWRGRFAADPRAVGRPILLNGLPYTVIGVMPAGFDLRADGPELWAPLVLSTADDADFSHSYLRLTGRLRPGIPLARAQGEADAAARRLAAEHPADDQSRGLRLEGLLDGTVGGLRKRLVVLQGAVLCVLLIACVNVANLLLVRGAGRSREIAVRAALGAGRGRIVRQLLTESLVLGLAGVAAGLLFAQLAVRALKSASPAGIPRLGQVGLDGPVLAFALAVGLAATLLFGLVPALRLARPDLQGMLKEGGRSLGAGSPRDRMRTALMAVEVALALVLLVGAGLLIRSATRMGEVELGFEPVRVLTARVAVPQGGELNLPRSVQVLERVIEEIRRLPGVESAAATTILPLSRNNSSSTVNLEGPEPRPGEELEGNVRVVTPGYFHTLGVPLFAGRDLDGRDRTGSRKVVVVNRSLARRAWPGRSAVGQRLWYYDQVWLEVVGVVGDIRQGKLTDDVRPELYVPLEQAPPFLWKPDDVSMAVAVRAAGDPARLAGSLRRAALAADSGVPVYDVRTLEEIRASLFALTRLNTLLLTALGAIGLLLAAVGIYGVIAYFVSQRTQEIGLRMALGATEGRVLALVVRQAMRPVLLGVAMGLAGAAAVTRAIAGILFEVSATDPATFGGVVLVLAAAALLASWLPAKRAARVDPSRALAP